MNPSRGQIVTVFTLCGAIAGASIVPNWDVGLSRPTFLTDNAESEQTLDTLTIRLEHLLDFAVICPRISTPVRTLIDEAKSPVDFGLYREAKSLLARKSDALVMQC
jgi:hypothetical protein